MASFVAVDYDPFAEERATHPAGAPRQQRGPRFVPVDHDPFSAQPTGQEIQPPPPNMPRAIAGFATRGQREGSAADLRQGEYLADAVRTRQQQDQAGPIGAIDAAARGVAGWIPGMDKLAAAGDAALGQGDGESFGDRYATNLERQRATDEADRLLNPNARMAGQAAGLVGTALVLPGVAVAREGVRGAAAANAAATGGLYGAAAGVIENDGGITDKVQAGLERGALGAGLGAVAPSIVRGVGAVARGVGNAASAAVAPVTTSVRGLMNPGNEAARRVGAALARDGVDDPAATLARMQSQGAPAVIGDIGDEATRALARSAANTSPEARSALNEAVSDRFAGQADRITETLRRLGPANATRTLEELEDAARAANKPAYAKAYVQGGRGVWNDDLAALAQAPAVQDAIRNVIKTGANKTVIDGMPPVRNPFSTDAAGNLSLTRNADGSVATPNVQFWDYIQRELRGKAGEAARGGNKDLAGDFTNLRRSLLHQLDDAVPAFKEARSGAAAAFEAENALEAGQKFVTARMRNEEAAKALAKMKPAERQLFAEGFRSDLIAKIRETGDGRDIVKAIFGSPAARQRVQIALGSKQAAELEAVLTTETTMLKLQEAVKGNSTTAQQLAMLGLAGGAGGALGGYQSGGDPMATAASFIAGAAARSGKTKIDAGLAKRVGQLLASGDVKALEQVSKMARSSPGVLKFVQDLGDEAAKVTGLSGPSSPLEITVRPGGGANYLPAAADQDQR